MELTFATIFVAFAGVFLISFMRGAFGGGFAIIGIPLLSIVMDPVTAGGCSRPCSLRWTSMLCAIGSRRRGRGRTSCCWCRAWWSASGSAIWCSVSSIIGPSRS